MEKYKYCITLTSSLEYTITLCVVFNGSSRLQRNVMRATVAQRILISFYISFETTLHLPVSSASVRLNPFTNPTTPGSQLDTAISGTKSNLNRTNNDYT